MENCVHSQQSVGLFSASVDLATHGVTGRPVEVLVPTVQGRSRGKLALPRVWRHEIPAGTMLRLEKGLLVSSPALYLRKKFAGRLMMRIIIAACTPRFVLICKRLFSIDLTEPISCEDIAVQSIHIAMPMSIFVLPLDMTGPVSAFVMRGVRSPMPVTASVESSTMTESLMVMQPFM
jgi:hypothetical protein